MRASCRACSRLYAKYGRIFRNCSGATAGLEAPTGDMHISSGRNEYIIHNLFRTVDLQPATCGVDLSSPSGPPLPPRRHPFESAPALSSFPLYPLSSASASRAILSFARSRRLKLIPNNACKSLGKCTSRVKTALPSAGNGGHSIFVQRCFRRCAASMERSRSCESSRCVRAHVNHLGSRIIGSNYCIGYLTLCHAQGASLMK